MNGAATLHRYAGPAAAAFEAVAAIGVPDLSDPAVAEFADQFALDVSSLDEGQRARFLSATGDAAFAVVQRIYAADFVPRVRAVLDAVFGPSSWPAPARPPEDAWPVIDHFLTEVARLRALDPVTTELVRLRGARLHDCAVCKSRRSQDAIDAGANETMFAAVDDHEVSTLPAHARAALALTDALVLTPGALDADELAALTADLTPEQVVEVTLDVMRNAANKIAVALAADAPTLSGGVELFTTDADGVLSIVGSR